MDYDVNKMSREDLEVHSRRMESELAVLNNRAAVNPEGFKKDVEKRTKNYQAIQKRIHELDSGRTPVDPEGTSQTLADAEGHYAADVKTAGIGGVGVRNSNSDPDGVVRRQRKQLEDQGIDPEQVPDNQLAGVNPSGADDSEAGKPDQNKEQEKDPAQQPKKK